MGKSHKWTCKRIIQKFHKVSELEIEQRLAELWELLVQDKNQLQSSQKVLVPIVKSQGPFIPSKRSKR